MELEDESASNNVLVQVKLQTPEGVKEILCPTDMYILDKAEEDGIDLPYSCKAGSCSSCVGRLLVGTVSQDDQSYLTEEQIKDGFVCLCVAYPQTPSTIATHQEEFLD
ncbi:2Fe-2S iron-sulfur cluster-binding protein [Actinobacillus equuli subsp. haemolyticus]|uniref:2Fe-2S iron-sulfur cluster-binding protein n=1 Tax=Actinobacillus equuli TaxID=718 RepID=UPI002441B6D3|nr:2Fe-2S iron-sulfur cluster-binding protein [Actinobacillus equuli]WGE53621.1 2Fe-2S iron-sulfur cluster-binding protein [Actinobacillus equuli subsp. haemolyticus]WGE63941.1 2Fe-2S iron-sulfur cluster-binding protein [Actinobacillus equuli subsp. haemolyticus]WGE68235.1 2Fe-2S iron-sulfur cluster-binding protein [Actinobacillus equuli subsp. haemolyticus]WGE74057.1 2Fe-2S iron-sulfur cluster-binding protein [Actinobacillus equuli subsp. haemolyticus]WGE88215.1 2Fe-2S iron-sulfur cluster-bin